MRPSRSVCVFRIDRKALTLAAGLCFLTRRRGALSASIALTLAPAAALAGAWTYPQGQGQIIETLFGWVGEGLSYGGAAGPKESRVEAQTYVEYGLSDRLTVVGQAALERYELTAPSADVFRGFDYSDIGLRAKLWSDDARGDLGGGDRVRPGSARRRASRASRQYRRRRRVSGARRLQSHLFWDPRLRRRGGRLSAPLCGAARRMAFRSHARPRAEPARDLAAAELQHDFREGQAPRCSPPGAHTPPNSASSTRSTRIGRSRSAPSRPS